MKYAKHTYRLILLSFLNVLNGFSQTTLQVVTKTVEKTFYKPTQIKIQAEKADIELIAWTNPELKLTVDLIAKHPERSIAETDLSNLQFVAEEIDDILYLRNYISVKNITQKPASSLKAKYVLYLPAQCKVEIKNNFGKIAIRGNSNEIRLNTTFCSIDLYNILGKANLETLFGDIKGEILAGNLLITSDRSDISFKTLKGTCIIKSQFGKINLSPEIGLNKLDIQANKSEITLLSSSLKNFGFYLLSEYGSLQTPKDFNWIQNSEQKKEATFQDKNVAFTTIKTTFGSISIISQ